MYGSTFRSYDLGLCHHSDELDVGIRLNVNIDKRVLVELTGNVTVHPASAAQSWTRLMFPRLSVDLGKGGSSREYEKLSDT